MTNTQTVADAVTNLERRRTLAWSMQVRSMANLEAKTTDAAPHMLLHDPAAYVDPHWLAVEKREIFQKLPLFAGLSRDLPEPGSKLLFEEAGPSILIVRTQDRSLRAYLNMCPHRAARIVTDPCNTHKRMSCPFHGWTFDLEGKLVGFPGRTSFELEPETLGLIRVPVAEWEGMIFVIARAGDDEIDVEGFLGELAPDLRQLDFAQSLPIRSTRFEAGGNWKLAVDTYGEGYHLSALHPESIARLIVTDSIIYDELAPHHRLGFPLRTMLDNVGRPQSEWEPSPLSVIYLLFPNTVISVTPRGSGAARTSGHSHHFYRIYPGQRPGDSFTILNTYRSSECPEDVPTTSWEEAHRYQVKIVGDEDYSAVAAAQRNLEHAPDGFRMKLGKNEISLQRFHERVGKLIGRL